MDDLFNFLEGMESKMLISMCPALAKSRYIDSKTNIIIGFSLLFSFKLNQFLITNALDIQRSI